MVGRLLGGFLGVPSIGGSKAMVRPELLVALLLLMAPLCGLLFRSDSRAGANTITVNTTSDASTTGDGFCSLREAINNANSPGVDTTGGDCAIGTGTDN